MIKDESILNTVKHYLGIMESDTTFDSEIIMLINSAFMVIMQEWHDVDHAFVVESATDKWSDFLGEDVDYEGLKTYISLKVKLLFDPPTNSAVIEALNNEMKDLEWRMYIWRDNLRLNQNN